jgi:hypothetical protein
MNGDNMKGVIMSKADMVKPQRDTRYANDAGNERTVKTLFTRQRMTWVAYTIDGSDEQQSCTINQWNKWLKRKA